VHCASLQAPSPFRRLCRLHLLHRFWRSQRETYRKRGIVYEAKGDRVRATADYDQADKLELQAMTKPSQAK